MMKLDPDQENQAPPEAAQGEKDDKKGEEPEGSKITAKHVGYAAIVLIGIFALVTILTRSFADWDEVASSATLPEEPGPSMFFNRIASFPVCSQIDANCNTDTATVSEIIDVSEDGNTLVYTDAALGVVGFIDITDATNPLPLGIVDVGGEPTSTAVIGNYAVVCVNTSPDYVNASGVFHVLDMATREVVHTMDLGGQPDSVSISPDKTFIAIAIENERDEDLNDGAMPQLPAGWLVVIDSSNADPLAWTLSTVDLTGLEGLLYDTDPEPEYIDINDDNVAVVTLQENNAIVLVDLATNSVINSFSAGTVDLDMVDVEDNGLIEQTASLTAVPREPDAVVWIGTEHFATADEGDMDGGTRGFTIFDTQGTVVYTSGIELEEWATRVGHYPEGRSDNKGNEPETVTFGVFGDKKLLFVNSERASLVFVYEVSDVTAPVLHQILPSAIKPEGSIAIPSRNLFVVVSEEDIREDKMRSYVTIYSLEEADAPMYPTLISADREDGTPRPFSALSGLSAMGDMLYTVEDSFFKQSRVFAIDTTMVPYTIVDDMRILDSNDALLDIVTAMEASIPGISAVLLNDDKSVNLDLEGIEAIPGGFWVVSEGSGTVGDEANPFTTVNLLIRLDETAVIQEVVTLAPELDAIQVRYGFEGVAVDGDNIVVAFQRAWGNETNPRVGIYNTVSEEWKFVFYPLDAPESQFGGWVGLSDLAALGNGSILVLERDDQGGPDAAIKRIYQIDFGDYSSVVEGTLLEKTFVYDLMPDLSMNGAIVMEKIEGMTVSESGDVWINNDNDGVDDNSGEQLLLNLGSIL